MFLKHNIWGISWMVVILVLSATPGNKLPPSPFLDFDKLIHAGIFGVLQFLLLRGFYLQDQFKILKNGYLWFALTLSSGYGVLMEVLQGEVFRNRSLDVYDMLANIGGIVLISIIWVLFAGRKRSKI